MLHTKTTKQNEKGFTIIEVLIVLAIAALILLIVFLAVPALQRSQRNNARKNDASRISTSLANFASNNNGTLAGVNASPGWWVNSASGDCITVSNDIGSLSEYGSGSGAAPLGGWCTNTAIVNGTAPAKGSFYFWNDTAGAGALKIPTPPSTTPTYAPGDELIYDAGDQCGTTGSTLSMVQGNSRQSALIYTQETSNTSQYTWACVNVT